MFVVVIVHQEKHHGDERDGAPPHTVLQSWMLVPQAGNSYCQAWSCVSLAWFHVVVCENEVGEEEQGKMGHCSC